MPSPVKTDSQKRRSRPRLIALLLVAPVLAAIISFRSAGRWLVREDALAQADSIVVLSGGMPYRAEGAAEIFRQGYAPQVWVSRPENPAQELDKLGIRFIGEEEYNRDVLVRGGVPANAVQILPQTIIDTEEEIREVTQKMGAEGKSRAIIVTSPQHTRRVRALWQRIASKDQTLVVRAAREDPFDADHWWHNSRDALAVVREYLGLLNVWTGLPVRPHSR
jgi:uncharacterized SAM-binding protein YcdF (DUF218 family)